MILPLFSDQKIQSIFLNINQHEQGVYGCNAIFFCFFRLHKLRGNVTVRLAFMLPFLPSSFFFFLFMAKRVQCLFYGIFRKQFIEISPAQVGAKFVVVVVGGGGGVAVVVVFVCIWLRQSIPAKDKVL